MKTDKSSKKVIIIGAGISGLTAAHLLLLSGLEVTLIEQSDDIGGQAKSGYTKNGFPTEHSLRTLHKGYLHLFEILKQLKENSYLDENCNLAQYDLCASYSDFSILFKQNKLGRNSIAKKIKIYLKLSYLLLKKGIKFKEFLLILKLMYLWNISSERLIKKYDAMDVATLFQLKDSSSIFFDTVFKITEIGSASKPHTSAILALKMLEYGFEMISDIHSVKMFNSPSSEALFNPWKKYLQTLGATIITNTEISHLKREKNNILYCKALDGNIISGAHFILAVDYNNAKNILLTNNLLSCTDFNVNILNKCFQWSNGTQFYLTNLPDDQTYYYPGLATAYHNSPWSIVTMIQGKGFWKQTDKIDKNLNILSITFTNVFNKGIIYHKPMQQCSADEIKEELLAQCGISDKSIIFDSHLDDALQYIPIADFENSKSNMSDHSYVRQDTHYLINSKMLFTPMPGYYQCAPKTTTSLENLYLAGDYCRTHYKIPTMEKACESGFHAANAILKKLDFPCFTVAAKENNNFFSRICGLLKR